jgi:hypothetical protein
VLRDSDDAITPRGCSIVVGIAGAARDDVDVTVTRVVSIGLVLASARPGEACTPGFGWLDTAITPLDGATDVPLNGVVTVVYRGFSEDYLTPGLAILDDQQQPIDATVQGFPTLGPRAVHHIVPMQPLQPNTVYSIADTVETCSPKPCTPVLTVKSTFTTGASLDTMPPATPPVPRIGSEYPQNCDSDSCCGPYSDVIITLVRPDFGDADHYDLYDGDKLLEESAPFTLRCVSLGNDVVVVAPGVYELTYHAVDVAGNVAVSPQPLKLSVDCGLLPPPPGGDLVPHDDQGCNANGAGAGWIPCVAALALRRRRRAAVP